VEVERTTACSLHSNRTPKDLKVAAGQHRKNGREGELNPYGSTARDDDFEIGINGMSLRGVISRRTVQRDVEYLRQLLVSVGRTAIHLIGSGFVGSRAPFSSSFTVKKLECSKQAFSA